MIVILSQLWKVFNKMAGNLNDTCQCLTINMSKSYIDLFIFDIFYSWTGTTFSNSITISRIKSVQSIGINHVKITFSLTAENHFLKISYLILFERVNTKSLTNTYWYLPRGSHSSPVKVRVACARVWLAMSGAPWTSHIYRMTQLRVR